ncbi:MULTISPECIES: IclR family transcriptional regulator [unclassified Microbacterium]|uniref:IclR family transcriptional regulator n=1 Tax=unclassified Microbacterium TaxID=2609290 RepID=UPI00214CB838|nr:MULTISPECIES: IclR family transcriptional regulator [unclassified Microbacterium]MCR2783237.1 IclR family transcriptional regulator [Microbacterium sp. zg.B96]WIM15887.1 IclR family transcriptional regulator [Microbacterium sp. zg-B96]
MARGSAGESALHRHLRVLDAFDALRPFLTLGQIAATADMPMSTAHRIVGELTAEGLLERMPDRTYRLGMRLWEYASRTPGALGLREVARPWLEAAHARIRQHVQLGVRAGSDVLFLERMSAPQAVLNATVIGGRIPLHASSLGLVLLAHAPDEVVDEAIAAGLRAYTASTITTSSVLRTVLRRVRADGFAVAAGHIHEESRGVAVPVRGPDGTVYAAMGAVIANDGSAEAAVVETLRVAAAGVTRALRAAYASGVDDDGHGPRPDAGISARSWEYIAALAAHHA